MNRMNVFFGMFFGLKDLFLHPDAFFSVVAREKVNLVPPLIILGTGILLTLLPLVIALGYYSLTASLNLANFGWGVTIGNWLCYYVLTPLVTWGVMFLGAYGISRVLDGKGSLAATVQNIGYGMMPWVVSVFCWVIFSGIIFVVAYMVPSVVGPLAEYANYGYGIVSNIGLIILFWEWYLWILAIQHTHRFTFRKAAAVSIVPVMIVIWLTIPVQAWIESLRMIITGS